MDILVYVIALGLGAAVIVPLLYGQVSKFLPSTLTTGVSLPTTFPTTFQGLGVSVILWGVFFGLALWALSYVPRLGSSIRKNA